MTTAETAAAATFAVTTALRACDQDEFHHMTTADQTSSVIRQAHVAAAKIVKMSGGDAVDTAEVAEIAESMIRGLATGDASVRSAVRKMGTALRDAREEG